MLDDDRRPAEAWARDRLAARGVEVVGEVAWPHVRAWSALGTLPTDGGTVWLKTVPEDLRHEAALTALVHRRRPDAVPEVLAVDEQRGWLLAADAGRHLRDLVPEERSLGRWHDALRLYAGVQRDLVGDVGALLAAGVPDLRGPRLRARYAAAVEDRSLGIDLGPDARASLPEVEALLAVLDASGLPDTVQHDDLHDAQVFVDAGGTVRLTDWGDSCVAHPFLSLAVTLDGVIGWGVDDEEGSEDTAPYLRSYLEVWAEATGRTVADLEPVAAAARVAGWACRVVNGHVPGDDGPTRTRLGMLLAGLGRP